MGVVRNYVTLFAHHTEKYAFRGAPLVGWNHVPVSANVVHRLPEAVKTLASSVALVTLHDSCPLMGRHGAGSRIRQEVNQDLLRPQKEEVVIGCTQRALSLLTRGPMKRLHAFDPEGFDNGAN